MTHASLFSGIGGFDLAAEMAGFTNVFQVENNQYAQKVLAKNFPDVTRYADIKEFNGTAYRDTINLLTGGFPCQPFSTAGKRQGEADDRYLWPEMLRVIREVKPTFVIGENVAGLTSMDGGQTLETICTDLEAEGYTVEPYLVPAAAVGAWHKRERIWIVAYTNSSGTFQYKQRWSSLQDQERHHSIQETKRGTKQNGIGRGCENATNSNQQRLSKPTCRKFGSISETIDASKRREFGGRMPKGWVYWSTEPSVGRVANGVPNRVDRLKGPGNAIVPQVAYQFMLVIKQLLTPNTHNS